MTPFPLTEELQAVARRIIWFEEPARALSDPVRFLAYAFERGTHRDFRTLRQHVSLDDLAEALAAAPPGIIGPRSWIYWNLVVGRNPPPPMPRRFTGP